MADTAVTQGLGLRWALTGPFMTTLLGGGGNPGGFRRVIGHLGPGFWTYAKEMDEHALLHQEPHEVLGSISDIVEESMGKVDTNALSRERDELLIEIMRLRKEKETLK